MGSLENIADHSILHLRTDTLVGKGPHCHLQRAESYVSQNHASISWRGGSWRILDLGSLNGTFINGKRLAAREQTLAPGDRIGLGTPTHFWIVKDVEPPSGRARSLKDGREIVSTGGALHLPSADLPEISVFQDAEESAWVLDGRRIYSGMRVTAGGEKWELELPGRGMVTSGPTSLSLLRAQLKFQVSADFEHVSLTLTEGAQTLTFPTLVTLWPAYLLAEERLRDQGVDAHDQGWIPMERLERKSDMDRRKIDIYVGRLKDTLAREGVADNEHIVEVRRGQRRIGVEPDRITIEVARRDAPARR